MVHSTAPVSLSQAEGAQDTSCSSDDAVSSSGFLLVHSPRRQQVMAAPVLGYPATQMGDMGGSWLLASAQFPLLQESGGMNQSWEISFSHSLK